MEKQFEFKRAGISDVYLITMKQIEDNRGGIVKIFSKEIFLQNGISFSPNEEIIIRNFCAKGLCFRNICCGRFCIFMLF